MSNEKNTSSFDLAKLLVVLTALFITPLSVKAATGQVDVSIQHQIIEGFGASGAWYEGTLTGHPQETTLYNILFGQLGLDIYRVRNTYGYDSGYIDRTALIVQGAETALGHPIKIMISSWSPPGYLKSCGYTTCYNGTLAGGLGSYVYTGFANWWYDSLVDFSSHGVDADYVNMQNEPDFSPLPPNDWDSCRFSPTQNSTFAGYREAFQALYTKLNSEMPNPPKLLVPEAVGMNNSTYYIDVLTTTDKSNVYGYAHHLYGDGSHDNPDGYITAMTNFAADYSDKPRLQTEFAKGGDGDVTTFPNAMNLARLMHNSLVYEEVSAYLYWELFWGPPKGLVSITGSSYTINPVYYAFKHYSAFTDPNWQRVDASTNSSNLKISAYISPDNNQMSVVIINTSASSTIPLTLSFPNITILDGEIYRTSETENCVYVGSFTQPLTLPASSITTIALTITLDTTPPAAPTNLLAAAGDEIVWLDWDDNTEPDFAGYDIYRSTTPGGYSSPLNTSLLDTSDYTDNDVNNGMTYYYAVKAVDTSTNESNYSNEVSASPSSVIGAMGTILREWWMGITGSSVSDLTLDPNFPHNPTNTEQIKSLEGPTNWADSYGARISGYLYPPATGSYTFWIASDANSELWLSTDGNPQNASLIAEANVPGYIDRRQWDKYHQQQSSPISLAAGQKYYIEVLHKEDTGPDNIAVAWQSLPGIPQQVIYGIYLSPSFIGFYGDFTDDSVVDMNDLAEFIKLWLEDGCQQTSAMDLDGDCIINFHEFSVMAENWRRIIAPSVPANLSITSSATSVSLDWDDNTESYIAGYNVYRSTTSGSGYSKLNSSLVSNSSYTDNPVTNGATYYYVVTAVDIYSNESGYSNEVSRLVIQEATTGFCGVDGDVKETNEGYTGIGYADTTNYPDKGVYWRISVPSSGTYTFTWRFDNGTTSNRPANLLVDGSPVESGISFPGSGSWSDWRFVSVNEPLTAGTKDICLKSPNDVTGDNGLANIDYLMVTGSASLIPVSCP